MLKSSMIALACYFYHILFGFTDRRIIHAFLRISFWLFTAVIFVCFVWDSVPCYCCILHIGIYSVFSYFFICSFWLTFDLFYQISIEHFHFGAIVTPGGRAPFARAPSPSIGRPGRPCSAGSGPKALLETGWSPVREGLCEPDTPCPLPTLSTIQGLPGKYAGGS
jgi:hypothetical protein